MEIGWKQVWYVHELTTDHSFAGMGACPEPTMKALSNEGEKTGLSKPEKVVVIWVTLTGEVNLATGQDEPVMASTEGNVKTTAGNLNVPDKASGELATSIAWPKLTLAISGRKLDIEAVFLQTAEMMAGNNSPVLGLWPLQSCWK